MISWLESAVTPPDKMSSVCLKWNDFQLNVSKSYDLLRQEELYCDVTLVSEDQKQMEAHKLVLSACSPFFKNILSTNSHSHPLLYMDGFNSSELDMILNYIYQGEAQVFQESLTRFMELAEKLRLDGLCRTENPLAVNRGSGTSNINTNKKVSVQENPPKRRIILGDNNVKKQENLEDKCMVEASLVSRGVKNAEIKTESEDEVPSSLKQKESEISKIRVNNSILPGEKGKDAMPTLLDDMLKVSDYKKTVYSMMKRENGKVVCTVCGKSKSSKWGLTQHVENHIEGLSYPCNYCDTVTKTWNSLRTHTYQCHNAALGKKKVMTKENAMQNARNEITGDEIDEYSLLKKTQYQAKEEAIRIAMGKAKEITDDKNEGTDIVKLIDEKPIGRRNKRKIVLVGDNEEEHENIEAEVEEKEDEEEDLETKEIERAEEQIQRDQEKSLSDLDKAIDEMIKKDEDGLSYICGVCEYKCNRRNNMRNHVKTHVPREPDVKFSCEYCGKNYGSLGSLRSHSYSVHRGKPGPARKERGNQV